MNDDTHFSHSEYCSGQLAEPTPHYLLANSAMGYDWKASHFISSHGFESLQYKVPLFNNSSRMNCEVLQKQTSLRRPRCNDSLGCFTYHKGEGLRLVQRSDNFGSSHNFRQIHNCINSKSALACTDCDTFLRKDVIQSINSTKYPRNQLVGATKHHALQHSVDIPNCDNFRPHQTCQVLEHIPVLQNRRKSNASRNFKRYHIPQSFEETQVLQECEQNRTLRNFRPNQAPRMFKQVKLQQGYSESGGLRDIRQNQTPQISAIFTQPPIPEDYSHQHDFEDLDPNLQHSEHRFGDPYLSDSTSGRKGMGFTGLGFLQRVTSTSIGNENTMPTENGPVETCKDIDCKFHNQHHTDSYVYVPRTEQQRVDEMANAAAELKDKFMNMPNLLYI